jgi:actin-related protein 3
VIGSCIKHIPLAGRDVTNFVVQQLRDRGEELPPEDALTLAKRIKEMYCYVCPDLVKEYKKYDEDPTKFRQIKGTDPRTNKPYAIDIGYERFLGPEIFFSPEIFSSDFTDPLPDVVDSTIQSCPIDTRRPLYNYITLSGGTTMFKHFTKRLERDIKRKVNDRFNYNQEKYPGLQTKKIDVNVITHPFQRFAVWFGGSMLASQPEFLGYFHTRAQYAEQGPRIARHNQVTNTQEPAHKSATNQELCTLEKSKRSPSRPCFLFLLCRLSTRSRKRPPSLCEMRCILLLLFCTLPLPRPERMRAAPRLRHRLSAALKR